MLFTLAAQPPSSLSAPRLHRFGWQEHVAAANRATCGQAAAAAGVTVLCGSWLLRAKRAGERVLLRGMRWQAAGGG